MVEINLKLLQAFLSVAEHGSFSKAAEHSRRSVPAMSMQIKHLEDQLGLALFRRTTRAVELTAEGRHLVGSVKRALVEIEHGLLHLRGAIDFQNARLSICSVPTVASSRLPKILSEFSKQWPNITVEVRELGVGSLLECVRKGEVDFALGPKIKQMRGFIFRSVFVDHYYALVEPNYVPQRRGGVTLGELAALPLLGLGATSAFRDDVDSAARKYGINLKTHYQFMQVNTMIAMAENGLGVAVVPSVAVPAQTRLKPLRIIDPPLAREIGIISMRGRSLSPASLKLIELIEQFLPKQLKA